MRATIKATAEFLPKANSPTTTTTVTAQIDPVPQVIVNAPAQDKSQMPDQHAAQSLPRQRNGAAPRPAIHALPRVIYPVDRQTLPKVETAAPSGTNRTTQG